jgi:hypothetical protein
METRRVMGASRPPRRVGQQARLPGWDVLPNNGSLSGAWPVQTKPGSDAERSAEARARKLLVKLLSPVQREELRNRDCFSVNVAGRGRFVILPRKTLNVLNAETGQCYCCVTERDIPVSDLMLAQKLMLENDPEQFFAVANSPSEFLFRHERRVSYAGAAAVESRPLSIHPSTARRSTP